MFVMLFDRDWLVGSSSFNETNRRFDRLTFGIDLQIFERVDRMSLHQTIGHFIDLVQLDAEKQIDYQQNEHSTKEKRSLDEREKTDSHRQRQVDERSLIEPR